MRESVSFIVIAHQNHKTLAACLEHIERDRHESDELILVLNHPDSMTLGVARQFPHWNLMFEPRPGPQHARNLGASKARNSLLFFFDADIVIDQGWTNRIVENFSVPWVAAGQSRIVMQKAPGFMNFVKRVSTIQFNTSFYFPASINRQLQVPTLDTANLMVRKVWFEKLKGFDPNLSRMEDTDFSLRLLYEGADIFFDDRLSVLELHDDSESLSVFLRKLFLSSRYLPLIQKKFGFSFQFPFSAVAMRTHPLMRNFQVRAAFFLMELVKLAGIALSPYPIELHPRQAPAIKRNQKAEAMTDRIERDRFLWVGGKKRIVRLFGKQFIKAQE